MAAETFSASTGENSTVPKTEAKESMVDEGMLKKPIVKREDEKPVEDETPAIADVCNKTEGNEAMVVDEPKSPKCASRKTTPPNTPMDQAARLAAVRQSAVGLRPRRNAGMIHMAGAPTLDIDEAKRQIMQDAGLAESPEMKELNEHLSADASGILPSRDDLEKGASQSDCDPDYLDTANEETFTLETFEALIRTARAAEKTFLVARVTTVDPHNLHRLYYSYYSAHQINKVIFRTQPEEGLLHRMKSRNPLNNMLIVGDVHYMAITPEAFDRAWANQQMQMDQKRMEASPYSSNGSRSNLLTMQNMSQSFYGGSGGDASSASPSNNSTNNKGPVVPVVYEAKFFATDDDFLMRADIREFFRKNSVNPDDYQLFQLHRRTDTSYEMTILGADGRPLLHGTQTADEAETSVRQASRLRTLCGLLDGGYHRNLVGFHTGYLSPLGFWVLMLSLTATVVVLSLLLLPAPTQYFALGGLMGVFCILLLFFVDWTDGRRP